MSSTLLDTQTLAELGTEVHKERTKGKLKTPHQELLDLGYTLISESEIYVNYTKVIDTKVIHLTFDKPLRRYKTWITYTPTGDKVPVFVSKTEAELFARYLDYMVNWREYVKEELSND